ncbi:hypothetical protein FQZ97_891890 [compost metagenome]
MADFCFTEYGPDQLLRFIPFGSSCPSVLYSGGFRSRGCGFVWQVLLQSIPGADQEERRPAGENFINFGSTDAFACDSFNNCLSLPAEREDGVHLWFLYFFRLVNGHYFRNDF